MSLPGSQISPRSQEHALEMLLLQLYRNGHTSLVTFPRSCTTLVRAVVPTAIPPGSLLLCHCSPSVVPMTNSCGVERQASPSPNHHGTMSVVADCEEAANVPQNILLAPQIRDRKGSLLVGVTGWLSQWSGPGMGNDLGMTAWMLLDIQWMVPVEGSHCLENSAGICS